MSSDSPLKNLRARLVVEICCPSCGVRNPVFLLDSLGPQQTHGCKDCQHTFPVVLRLQPSESKVAYRYVELALEKWSKEFLLIAKRLGDASVTVEAPIDEMKPSRVPSSPGILGTPSSSDGSDEVDEGRLTHYRKGTGAGVGEIRDLLKSDPENRQLKEWLAFALYTNDMYDEAIGAYLELIESRESDPISHYYLANSYFRSGYVDAAREEWQRVVELTPDSPLAKKASERIKNPRI